MKKQMRYLIGRQTEDHNLLKIIERSYLDTMSSYFYLFMYLSSIYFVNKCTKTVEYLRSYARLYRKPYSAWNLNPPPFAYSTTHTVFFFFAIFSLYLLVIKCIATNITITQSNITDIINLIVNIKLWKTLNIKIP